jgi:hypothetical protein
MKPISEAYSRQILHAVTLEPKLHEQEGSRITVHETVSRFAVLYEKIRGVVDYKDEHLIRKGAILRIMKRLLLMETDPRVIADRLVRELIGARYLPNGVLPESVIGTVALRIRKYQAVERVKAGSERHLEWLRGIVSVEIEDALVDPLREKALVTFLYERVVSAMDVKGTDLDDTERRLQTYVACYRSLIKADDEMLGYKLLRAYLPEWLRYEDWIENPRPIAERLVAVERRIRSRLKHRLSQKFLRAVKPWAVSLTVLRNVLLETPKDAEDLLKKPDALGIRIARKADELYSAARGKLRRGTFRAIVYLFFTKMVVALLLEVPIELYWYEHLNYLALSVNLLFPPTLMFLVGLFIRVPGTENTDRLRAGVEDLLSDEPLRIKEIRAPKTRKRMTTFWFTLVYAGTFLLSFGVTVSVLRLLNFTELSIGIFLFFLCVVSFFAFRLRATAREVVVVEGKQGFFAMLADFYSFPILRAGQWLSRSINRINVFLFIFDFMFEAPFKIFLTVLEEWFAFMKEKKEDLQ